MVKRKVNMSVEELIRLLEQVADKTKQVFVYVASRGLYPLFVVSDVYIISDRVDINVVEST